MRLFLLHAALHANSNNKHLIVRPAPISSLRGDVHDQIGKRIVKLQLNLIWNSVVTQIYEVIILFVLLLMSLPIQGTKYYIYFVKQYFIKTPFTPILADLQLQFRLELPSHW